MKICSLIKEKMKNIFISLKYQCRYIPEGIGIYRNRIIALLASFGLGLLAFFLMCYLDFFGLFDTTNSDPNATITSIFIGCVSMLASSIGLVIAAFVFLNDSLKEQAGRDSTLQYITKVISKKKMKELIWVSGFSIVAIVGSLYSNTYLEESFCLPIKTCDKHICITGNVLFYACISLCVALLTYIIVFACGMINSEKVIEATARMNERRYRNEIIRAIRKVKKERKCSREKNILKFYKVFNEIASDTKNNTSREELYNIIKEYSNDLSITTFNEQINDLTPDQFTVQYIKDINQIESILKTLCDNNIEPNTINQVDRMERGFRWYLGVFPQMEVNMEYQIKNRYECILRSTYDYYVSRCDAKVTDQEKIWECIKKYHHTVPPTDIKISYTRTMEAILNSFFAYYKLLVRYKEALIHIDKKYYKQWKQYASTTGAHGFLNSIYILEQDELNLLLNCMMSFARLTDLSLGSSRLNRAYLVNSDLTNGCYVNSNFAKTHLENAILKDCDFSCTNCDNIYANYADFRRSNLSHANFAGARLLGTNLSDCVMEEITFRSKNIEKDKEFDFSTIKFETVYSSLYGTVQRKLLDNTGKICLIRYIKNLLLYDRYYMVRQIRICLDELFVQYMSNMMNLIPIIEETRATITDIQALQNMSSHGMGYVVAYLSNATISNSLMRQVDLSSMDLVGASFDESIMTGMIAINSNATGTIFKKSNLKEAVFGGTNFQEAVFDEANLYNAKFINVAASKSSFCGASMAKVVIANTRESFSVTSYMTNETVTMNESVEPCLWTNLAIKQATAIDALVFNVCMDESNFNKSIFKRAVIYNTLMRWSSLVDCDLSYTMLVGCTFFQSDFYNALLSKSILFSCDFSNSNMGNTKLIDATADKCIFRRTTFEDANLSNMTFQNCYFEDVSFKDTYVSNTKFKQCVFKQMIFHKDLIREKKLLLYDNSKHSIYIDQNHNLYIDVRFINK